jgi:predicted alpha/beta-fold hydrolase
LEHEHEGKIALDVVQKKANRNYKREKVLVLLHGVTGNSLDPYMIDVAGVCAESGINTVIYNHFAPPGEYGLRMQDLSLQKYLDEVIHYSSSRFSQDGEPCDVYLAGFSLGGNHVLRYVGQANKNKLDNSAPQSSFGC